MHKYKKSLTNSLEKIIINKHWKTNACLAQSVEHSAVNRSVGGPSPSTGAKKGRIRRSFFILPLLRGTPWRAKHRSSAHCASTLLPKWTLGKTINKFIFLRYYTGVRVPQQAPKRTQIAFFFYGACWVSRYKRAKKNANSVLFLWRVLSVPI